MPNMSAKFDQEAHNSWVSIMFTSLFPYMSIVTSTFDLWPPKSIGIFSPCLTCLPSLTKRHTTVTSLSCSQAYFHICPLWPWPLTSKIKRVSSSYHGWHVCKVWQRNMERFSLYRVHKVLARTEGRKHWQTEPQKRYYIPPQRVARG